jgi:transcriptional regulator with XRE-family HTH domain
LELGLSNAAVVTDDPLIAFGNSLRRLREERGLSQDALAQRAGMDPAEIRRIESARRDPGVRVVTRLARALSAKPADLFESLG